MTENKEDNVSEKCGILPNFLVFAREKPSDPPIGHELRDVLAPVRRSRRAHRAGDAIPKPPADSTSLARLPLGHFPFQDSADEGEYPASHPR